MERHSAERICQGDIVRDITLVLGATNRQVEEYAFPYAIVVSQDCDLEQFQNSLTFDEAKETFGQYMPFVLLVPAFPAEDLREGHHLKGVFGLLHERINSRDWNRIKQNREARYHFINGMPKMQVQDLACDFKHYFTMPSESLMSQFPNAYLATINELFREEFSQRFAAYLSRIGLPEFSRSVT